MLPLWEGAVMFLEDLFGWIRDVDAANARGTVLFTLLATGRAVGGAESFRSKSTACSINGFRLNAGSGTGQVSELSDPL
jgi:hypothetical protein